MLLLLLLVLIQIVNGFNIRSSSSSSISLSSSLTMKITPNDISTLTYHVSDIKRSINFYTDLLGLKLINNKDNSALISLIDNTYIELINNNKQDYNLGDGFVGIGINKNAIDSNNIIQKCSNYGGNVILDINDFGYGACLIPDEDEMKVTPVRYGRITDPDGYNIEITEIKDSSSSVIPNIGKIRLNVVDWEESEKFYMEILGMKLFRRRSNINSKPKKASITSYLGYNSESTGTILELTYPYSTDVLDIGNGYNHIKFTCSDISWTRDKIKTAGIAIDEDNGTSLIIKDPNNYKLILSS